MKRVRKNTKTKTSAKKQNTLRFLQSAHFWIPFAVTLILAGLFFAWELGVFINIVPSFPRPSVLPWELEFTATISMILAFDIGLAIWQSRFGSCPRGVKRASGIAAAIGALTLICPACVLLPASLISVGFVFSFLTPHLALLRIVAIVLLLITAIMLWPRRE